MESKLAIDQQKTNFVMFLSMEIMLTEGISKDLRVGIQKQVDGKNKGRHQNTAKCVAFR